MTGFVSRTEGLTRWRETHLPLLCPVSISILKIPHQDWFLGESEAFDRKKTLQGVSFRIEPSRHRKRVFYDRYNLSLCFTS